MIREPARPRRLISTLVLPVLLAACGNPPNNPYPAADNGRDILYTSFEERPKHLDPARAYNANEFEIIAQIYEPPLQYAYLKRPYQLEPLAAESLPEVRYLDREGRLLPDDAPDAAVAFSRYDIRLRPDLRYQPHPALAQTANGDFPYHALTAEAARRVQTLGDFPATGTRTATAEDFVYQIKRLAHPAVHSPIAELMKSYIVGLAELGERLEQEYGKTRDADRWLDLRQFPLAGVEIIDSRHYTIRLKGKYPQFRFWLAMPFFAPMPWEADAFYSQPALQAKNISLDWYPIGTGAFQLAENNPNRRMVLVKNPNVHPEAYPAEGEPGDGAAGLLRDAGKPMPFIERVVFVLERETIPYWNKFLQGYYDASGLASDNFDQAVRFSGQGDAELTAEMRRKGIRLQTEVAVSDFYFGFNMLDPVVGGLEPARAKLRQAISIALDEEEYIAIFMNGRGIPAQGVLPPGIFGHVTGAAGINPYVYDWVDGGPRRKSLEVAKRLLAEAGYPDGLDAAGKPLVLYLDTTATGPDDKAMLNWYRKQFAKLGIQLVLRTTDYNQFQQKLANGNAQLYRWGWNADYPDPENFFFLLYGANAKVGKGGENASNYLNPEFDRRFERMQNLPDTAERLTLIGEMQDILRRDAPWVFGVHPKGYVLSHAWYQNRKPNLMANNSLKYLRIDGSERAKQRAQWNRPLYWPLLLLLGLSAALLAPAYGLYRRRQGSTAR